MTKSSGLKNAPSTTGKPSGGGRGNNPPKRKESSQSIYPERLSKSKMDNLLYNIYQ